MSPCRRPADIGNNYEVAAGQLELLAGEIAKLLSGVQLQLAKDKEDLRRERDAACAQGPRLTEAPSLQQETPPPRSTSAGDDAASDMRFEEAAQKSDVPRPAEEPRTITAEPGRQDAIQKAAPWRAPKVPPTASSTQPMSKAPPPASDDDVSAARALPARAAPPFAKAPPPSLSDDEEDNEMLSAVSVGFVAEERPRDLREGNPHDQRWAAPNVASCELGTAPLTTRPVAVASDPLPKVPPLERTALAKAPPKNLSEGLYLAAVEPTPVMFKALPVGPGSGAPILAKAPPSVLCGDVPPQAKAVLGAEAPVAKPAPVLAREAAPLAKAPPVLCGEVGAAKAPPAPGSEVGSAKAPPALCAEVASVKAPPLHLGEAASGMAPPPHYRDALLAKAPPAFLTGVPNHEGVAKAPPANFNIAVLHTPAAASVVASKAPPSHCEAAVVSGADTSPLPKAPPQGFSASSS
uniref:Uncharacterized protein n=1 Tax=Noctiluca scintillans TaxID=2966 RepID=A0A7S1A758_NOCSC|mmetsp:Transcript_34075/g.90823  ORF Transcript_34075/g.90823 Transcript_34075/m.90823 type:complete len:464 (+) Transcript_34075:81-1472(+)|eukprot:CAMPEP_0194512530 /NCGR_PEP_ID=MMETSP0253-20130528/44547_1 /TAXON_ID=2966 /ORGANISM="Noctiluca scintillans" /LENGTH=463 /DNA_ID=CAMNT_0039355993 /DNA_START=67 /DNA_END=1458 /DNA_ORIENTATION=-